MGSPARHLVLAVGLRRVSPTTLRRARPGLQRAVSRQDVWPFVLMICACLFFCDVLVRRVAIHFYWVGPALQRGWSQLRGAPDEAGDEDQRIERLRSRKAEIAEQIDERRAATRFEDGLDPLAAATPQNLDDVLSDVASTSGPASPAAPAPETSMDVEEETGYTARLLEAKKRAMQDRKT